MTENNKLKKCKVETQTYELNKIYCEDCYEAIKKIPSKSVDLIITDPPYQFDIGGSGSSELAKRKDKNKNQIYKLDTEHTRLYTGGGCFGTKNRDYYSQFNETDTTPERRAYLDYIKQNGKDEESERLRVIANNIDNGNKLKFISKGITNEILEEWYRVMKKINIYMVQ